MRFLLSIIVFFLFGIFFSSGQSLKCPEAGNGAAFLKGNWVGEFSQYACGVTAKYPMTVEIKNIKGKKFSGFFVWTDMSQSPDSKTTLAGKIKNNDITMKEDELISGGGLVLNGIYVTEVVDCETLKGIWKQKKLQPDCNDPQSLIDGGNFTIHKVVPKKKPTKRQVVVKEKLMVTSNYLTIDLWDNGMEDGDIVTLLLNKEVILEKYEVKKEQKQLLIPLNEGTNTLELFAENVGKTPPNTAAFSLSAGGKELKRVILKSDYNVSEAIEIDKTAP